jgi:hypothetical protein
MNQQGTLSFAQTWNLMRAAAKRQKYQGGTLSYAYAAHPFTEKVQTTYCGTPGASNSVGDLIDTVMTGLIDFPCEEANFSLYMAPAEGTGGYDVVSEVEIIYSPSYRESYLCSGLTDYSGTGGAALEQVKEWMNAMDALTNADAPRGITVKIITQTDLRRFYDLHNASLKETDDTQ